ncbi:probable Nuclear protein localization protein 4 [Saccharomycodes ludwigii]|uniref:Nuclear protein localization protein 4 n=1 Tax=Saccharomycodes ludwigii TaxID=36035 RepID=A0A376B7Y3_9ASCO|nr:hypothetical protein SCDLUD_002061 [Saccharomycodes ludwigii]KAH3902244.1 hypothetical protein SCDLUD_002061 [Saccharomycodes ludwigii]SSD60614.1 probable Nuclear protein localization protein 4 [Saccharomycodes ludwigii]
MLLRFRSKEGIHRVQCAPETPFGEVVQTLLTKTLNKNPRLGSIKISCNGRNVTLDSISDQSVQQLDLKHGDMLTIDYEDQQQQQRLNKDNNINNPSISLNTKDLLKSAPKLPELPVDIELSKENGLIPRKQSKLCKHGDKGMCEYCSPLPPWDRTYKEENNIKHISFHAYVKSLEETTKTSGSSYVPPLSQPDFRITKKATCTHEPWPRGLCSKCQPSAITLQQQSYRMVDHVEFSTSELMNEFIDSWRQTGTQRFGVLYGTYEKYDTDIVPLGIKAIVQAIYEPPQDDETDGITMSILDNSFEEELCRVDKVANNFGIYRIGMIFTDLTDSGKGDGSVLCKRHKDSYFLTSLEVIMSAKHQLKHRNICHKSEQGIFSSKFVTCCISGNLEGDIEIAAYQVSTDGEALVQADMISGSTHPSMAWINETNEKRYVPEIFYTKKNEYNLTVKENAKPAFPIDYLLVSLTHGFPENVNNSEKEKNNDGYLKFKTIKGFPWSNRQSMGYSQDYHELKRYLFATATSGDLNALLDKLSNFQLLIYIGSLDILSSEEWGLLVESCRNRSNMESLMKLISTPGWQTLIMILQETM